MTFELDGWTFEGYVDRCGEVNLLVWDPGDEAVSDRPEGWHDENEFVTDDKTACLWERAVNQVHDAWREEGTASYD